jgi:hypothetical protein
MGIGAIVAEGGETPSSCARLGAIRRMSMMPSSLPAAMPVPTIKKEEFSSGWLLRHPCAPRGCRQILHQGAVQLVAHFIT